MASGFSTSPAFLQGGGGMGALMRAHDETCRALRSRPAGHSMKTVALTGGGQEEDRRKSAEVGFDAHLVKPADFGALQALLATSQAR